jgi:hypothetical protein
MVSSWKKRIFKIREDAVLFYFEDNTCKGSIDFTECELKSGNDRNLEKSRVGESVADTAIPVDVRSTVDQKTTELVFETKENADAFCVLVSKVATKHNVEEFVTDFHWKIANRGFGDDNPNEGSGVRSVYVPRIVPLLPDLILISVI